MSTSIEEALSRTGWGLYSKFLFAFAALCYFSNALVFMNAPLYLPLISCDMASTETTVYTLEICFSLGLALGGFFFSSISDVVGRKTILAISLGIIFMGSLMSSFAYNAFNLAMANLIVGSGLASNLNVAKLLVAESFPQKRRYASIVLLDLFWNIGVQLSMAFYVVTMPFLLKYLDENKRLFNWRLVQTLTGCLSLVLSCMASLLLESPRYLIFERRSKDALDVLRQIYAINNSKIFIRYPVTETELQGKVVDFGISSERDMPNTISVQRCKIIFRRVHKSMLILIRKRFFFVTFSAITLNAFISIGLHQLTMLLMKTLPANETTPVEGIQIQYFQHPVFRDCTDFKDDMSIYRDFSILSLASTAGTVTLAVLISFVEYKYLMVSFLMSSFICALALAYVYGYYFIRYVLSLLFLASFSMAESCLTLIIIDAFPTAVRGTALGETMIFSRLVNMLLKQYLWLSSSWLFAGIASSMALGALISFLLPKLKNRPMTD